MKSEQCFDAGREVLESLDSPQLYNCLKTRKTPSLSLLRICPEITQLNMLLPGLGQIIFRMLL